MALPLYLALTAAEIQNHSSLPPNFAYMACHFSPYGTGLSNLPRQLPPGALLMLNDRIPIHGHDHSRIREELEEIIEKFQCWGLLLDFQRPLCDDMNQLTHTLCNKLSVPVGVSNCCAAEQTCPVCLPPVPPDIPLKEYLHPWQGREIWLETALDGTEIQLTPSGAISTLLPYPGLTEGFACEALHCHYQIQTDPDCARFTLFRTRQDLGSLLHEAETWGVTRAVGLWQELG